MSKQTRRTPKTYQNEVANIIQVLKDSRDKKIPVIVEERRSSDTNVVTITFVGPRFATGHVTCMIGDALTSAPYTIGYTDLVTGDIRLKGVNV